MNIVVCVKHVPDATADRRFEADGTVDRVGVDGLLSELDEYAVEQALQINERLGGDSQVTVVTVGPEKAADAIRKALQMGADKGVHVLDEAIAGSDALATSLVLAAAIGRLDHDLVVCGLSSTDGAMGVVPAMLSERLGVPGRSEEHTFELQSRQYLVCRLLPEKKTKAAIRSLMDRWTSVLRTGRKVYHDILKSFPAAVYLFLRARDISFTNSTA